MRGPDWKWADQDGGKGKKGTVIELKGWRGEADRKKFGARVRWDHGATNLYRWGAEDAYDLQIIGAVDVEIAKAYRQPAPRVRNCNALDREVLLAVYRATRGDAWPPAARKGWEDAAAGSAKADPCIDKWRGVVCEESRVVALDLSSNRIATAFPRDVTKLERLKTLALNNNRITGSIPPEMGRLRHLRWLALSDNMLSGSIPLELTNLPDLEWMQLYNNRLSGTIPETLGGLDNLEQIHLQNNALTGTIPASLGNMAKLHTLYLQNNPGIAGALPESVRTNKRLRHLKFPRTVLEIVATPEVADPNAPVYPDPRLARASESEQAPQPNATAGGNATAAARPGGSEEPSESSDGGGAEL